MKNLMGIVRKAMTVAAFLTISVAADAAEVMYKIVEYNKQTAEFAIAACGTVPRNSRVDFENFPHSLQQLTKCRKPNLNL